MRIIKISAAVLFCILLSSCSKKPDVMFVNGRIYTLDRNNTIAEAIAVSEGKVIAVGSTAELTEKYSSDRVIDLKGRTVIPGFIDAEGNLMEFSRNLNFIDLRQTAKLNEILGLVREKVNKTKEGEWIGGFGWNELELPPEEYEKLDHSLLDSISTKHKIYLVNSGADITWVNQAVLDAAKITGATPNPPGGEVEKNDNGKPTGLLFDDAQDLVIKVLPQPAENEVIQNVQQGISELFKYGITEVSDANMSEEILNIYKKMVDENKFPLMLYAMIGGKSPLFEKYLSSGPEVYKDRISVKCMYLEFDGYFETQDAAMYDDYLEEPKRKIPYNDEFDIREMSRKAFGKGFQVSVKAVGDRAVNQTLNALETVMSEVKPAGGRTRLEYVEFVQPADMQRIKQLGIIPSLRPEVTLNDRILLNDLIKPGNAASLGQWSSLMKQNDIVISGTDFPYHFISPLMQIYYLTTGMPLDTALARKYNNMPQKLSITDALKSFTVWAAYANFEEDIKGSLESGKLADMVVLSEDIISSDPAVLPGTRVLMTVVRGEVVYEFKPQAVYNLRSR